MRGATQMWPLAHRRNLEPGEKSIQETCPPPLAAKWRGAGRGWAQTLLGLGVILK